MSHCTTATTTYVVAKYSRSYPPGASASQQSVESEWQHYANPVIRLVLDVTKSSTGELVLVRLRILWDMNAGSDSMDVDQREIVFEDLDLLSFSNLSSGRSQTINHGQGLPLKAVYRDTVVGIRYLHPRAVTAGSSPAYRRFQITFLAPSAASQFLDAIRGVCPCKANVPAPTGRITTTAPHVAQNTTPESAGFPSALLDRTGPDVQPLGFSVPARFPPTPIPSGLPAPPSSPFNICSNPVREPISSSPKLNLGTSSLPLASSPSVTSVSQMNATRNARSTHEAAPFAFGNRGSDKSTPGTTGASKNTSLPSSSPPSSSVNSNSSMMPPPPPPQTGSQSITSCPHIPDSGSISNILKTQFVTSLKETPSLYSLSKAELEDLVSEVVREEGFTKLLENLDSMWKVKGFLGR